MAGLGSTYFGESPPAGSPSSGIIVTVQETIKVSGSLSYTALLHRQATAVDVEADIVSQPNRQATAISIEAAIQAQPVRSISTVAIEAGINAASVRSISTLVIEIEGQLALHPKIVTEFVKVAGSPSRSFSFVRRILEPVDIIGSIIRLGGVTNVVKMVNSAVTIVESSIRLGGAHPIFKFITDIVGIAETPQRSLALSKLANEISAIADLSRASVSLLVRQFAPESVAIADLPRSSVSLLVRQFCHEVVAIKESRLGQITNLFTYSKIILEKLKIGESKITKFDVIRRYINETVKIVEAVYRPNVFVRFVTDVLKISEFPRSSLGALILKVLMETVIVSETLSQNLGNLILKLISETVSLLDNPATRLVQNILRQIFVFIS